MSDQLASMAAYHRLPKAQRLRNLALTILTNVEQLPFLGITAKEQQESAKRELYSHHFYPEEISQQEEMNYDRDGTL